MTDKPVEIADGVSLWSGYLGYAEQCALMEEIRGLTNVAPFVRPMTPWGKPMSVQMTSAGRVGWVTDCKGYRYEPSHPETGEPWPPIPESVLKIWRDLSGQDRDPDCMLVNHYREGARMGMHRDEDEGDFSAPVVSISLGDAAIFRLGGLTRKDPAQSFSLLSGDVLVMGGPSRLAYHGVSRIRFGESALTPEGGRINLTLRVVADQS